MAYFLRRGIIGIRIVFWPVTLLVSCFTESERRGYLDQLSYDLRAKNYMIKPDTALEMADYRGSAIDQNCDAVASAAQHAMDIAGEIPATACRTGAVAVALTSIAAAQTPPATDTTAATAPSPSPTTSILLLRTGENLQSPFTSTYRLFEFFQIRGKWIYPDLGCVDFATGKYRECFAGFDRIFFDGKRVTLTGAFYFVQATGPAAHSARYFWPNPILDIRFTPKLTSQTSYFPYVPLNRAARIQQVLERTKLEYAFAKHLKAGGGYGAYQFGNGPWQSKPFITTTVKTRAGSFEFWIQKMPQGAQIQMRYSFAHTAGPHP
jgi:hypothetical protein